MQARIPPSVAAPRRGRGLPVWLPWAFAPGFLLLPIGGCGVAASLRRPRPAAAVAAADPTAGAVTTVATVVPMHRTVAWPQAAN